ncbi:lytic transglycosylase domain-containing protein [Qipengyuania sp. YIM B01966]|uniref:lytic transglycosylase domain-containing protein n=1 Tax=Qipengyuania sp. YIM B01966 TaxID=2778646 RepID=UPI0018F5C0DF|nr:lytic transglycosylase domain-containing protein [Qipengyuania sp. YIM B01966]
MDGRGWFSIGRSAGMLAGALVMAVALPAPATANSSAEYFRARATSSQVPTLLSAADRDYYSELFRAIDRSDWSRVGAMLAQRGDGPLHQVARAEYYLASGSPRVEAPAIEAWLAGGRELPQANALVTLGQRRGLSVSPALPAEQSFVRQGSITKRTMPRAVADGTMPATVSTAILDRIKNDDPDGARLLLDGVDAGLSPAARAEWRQRVAWSYYIENNDPAALAMAQTARSGSGAWVAEGDWVAGLAAWRLGDCAQAAEGFERAARAAENPELGAAAYYWASRAQIRCRAPEKAAELLRGAARQDETLYGMIAREALGQQLPREHAEADFTLADWQHLRDASNVRTAVALVEIGQDARADDVLRHQARIGDPRDFRHLSRLARELGMPGTQMWMAQNRPRGADAEPALHYPVARWAPVDGWTVDPALAYAHTLQESNFRAAAVSGTGARGLMQIMPAAARDHAASLGVAGSPAELNRPEINLSFGQRHLRMLRDNRATGGLLPKIMAAYNAGLTPVSRWNSEVRDQGDPLLYMESIPYWETRGYVAIVLRNYWMYERQAGAASPSRAALAQGLWPTFPDQSGGNGVRVSAR